jgi:hypothetical protein
MKYFSDKLMAARSNEDADLIDEYRNIIKASRDYIEAMQSLHGPDIAGIGLQILNRIDKVL